MNPFSSLDDFLAMGNHGVYVWSAYGLCLALLAWNALLPMLARRRYLKSLARRLRREDSR
ncbi:heme exporter protein CcmD [Bordetella sp. BOR01]|uniref:heme exporter protein CcmD n=1 Tax=Bordetella sp. BOR01 TaxID=2854779 RepID=UPI001C47476C|nr:heme exporter protein CcmD [Bordetella sp. BOR01]MBV7483595.1 heme exporter protein CcmD [Bordetella sp. BOR01]